MLTILLTGCGRADGTTVGAVIGETSTPTVGAVVQSNPDDDPERQIDQRVADARATVAAGGILPTTTATTWQRLRLAALERAGRQFRQLQRANRQPHAGTSHHRKRHLVGVEEAQQRVHSADGRTHALRPRARNRRASR